MTLETPADRRRQIGHEFIDLFAAPRPTEELQSVIDELVAGDHVAYGTSWGTLLGRRALLEYTEVSQAAFPSLSYRIDNVARLDDVVYCQWEVDETHWLNRHATGGGPSPVRRTMTVRIADDRITETWQPCDPWLPVWSEVPTRVLGRVE